MVLSNMGHVARNQGDLEDAKAYYQRSLNIRREVGDRYGMAISLNELGAVALMEHDLAQSERYYREALSIRRGLQQPYHLAEDWIGLARLNLAREELETAMDYAKKAAAYLDVNPTLAGAIDPLRDFRFLWEVLQAVGTAEDADRVLSLAVGIMEKFLQTNEDPAAREMYLRQPHHALLWSTYERRIRSGMGGS